jgi:hypothetical protein
MYRNADLETILATDLNQLGQVPKLQTLAMAALRTRLLADLDALLSTFSKVDGGKSKAKVDAEVSPRSCILDGSPKSLRPTEFGCDPEMQHVALPCLSTPPAVRTPEITAAISPLMADSMVRFLAAITLAVRHAVVSTSVDRRNGFLEALIWTASPQLLHDCLWVAVHASCHGTPPHAYLLYLHLWCFKNWQGRFFFALRF